MFGRRFCVWNFHEMNQTPIVILIAVFIASAHIQNVLVVASDEQQQAEQLGKTNRKNERQKKKKKQTENGFYPSDDECER